MVAAKGSGTDRAEYSQRPAFAIPVSMLYIVSTL